MKLFLIVLLHMSSSIYLFANKQIADKQIPLRIESNETKSYKQYTGLCFGTNQDFNVPDSSVLKSYIKLIPKDHFSVYPNYKELCVTGLKPQTSYTVTIDKSIPLGSKPLDKTYIFREKTGDLEASLNFKENGYILPANSELSIPIESMNIDTLSVSLYRLNRNNLMSAINEFGLTQSIYSYKLKSIKTQDGYFLWKKKLPLTFRKNHLKTTAIPVGKYLGNIKPGVYMLYAAKDIKGEEEDYYSSHTASQWFMISDIGLFTLEGEEGMNVYTKHLSDASIYDNVKLELVSKNNEILATTTTQKGHAFFKKSLLLGENGLAPEAIYAYGKDGDFTAIILSRPALDLTDRGVAGREMPVNYDAFLFTNRGIFKPTEAAPVNILIRDNDGKVAKNLKITLKLYDASSTKVSTQVLSTDEMGFIQTSFDLSVSQKRGKWKVKAFAGSKKPIGAMTFIVDDFIPPKIEVSITKQPDFIEYNQTKTITAIAKYLTGGSMANPSWSSTITLGPASKPFKGYEDYKFSSVDAIMPYEELAHQSMTGDENGTIIVPLKITHINQKTYPQNLNIILDVNEPGGRAVQKNITVFYDNRSGYIGVKPKFKDGSVDLESKPSFDVVYISHMKPVKQQLTYKIIAEDVQWDWISSGDSWEYSKSYSDINEVANGNIDVGNTPTNLQLDKLDWGYYKIKFTGADNARCSYRFSVGYEQSMSKASPDKLPIITNKKQYSPTDTVKVKIIPKFSGKLLINVANSKIISSKELDAHENIPLEVELPISKKWGTSAYILVTEFRSKKKKRGSPRAVGVAHVSIQDNSKIINLSLKSPKRIDSKTNLKVQVSSTNISTPTYVKIMAVDKGILNITNFKAPNPKEYFWGQKKLGIKIRDMYAELIKTSGEHGEFAVGADDIANLEDAYKKPTTNKRKIIALQSKTLLLDKNAQASVDFNVSSFQGTIKLMAVAWNKDAVGNEQNITLVKDPVSIEAYMPRFLALGDTAHMLIGITFDDNISKGEYHLDLDSSGGIEFNPAKLIINHDDKSIVYAKINATAKSNQDSNLTIRISNQNKKVASRRFSLAVRPAYLQSHVRKVSTIQQADTLDTKTLIEKDNYANISKISLKVTNAPTIPTNTIEKELIDYCCRCAEQTSSRAFAFLSSSKQSEKELVIQSIKHLQSMQKIDGSYGLWVNSQSSTWVTSYALDFLTQAKKADYKINEKYFQKGLSWLEDNLYKLSTDVNKQESDSYALYVLAENGKVLISDINYHINNPKTLIKSAFGIGHLAATLNIIGEKNKSKIFFEKAIKALGNSDTFSNYGGTLRDKAALIVLLQNAKMDTLAAPLYSDLAMDTKSKQYLSTQEMSQILRASHAVDPKESELNISVNGHTFTGKEYLYKTDDIDDMPTITNNTQSNIWYTLGMVAQPNKAALAQTKNHGFSINKELYTMDGKKIDIEQITKNQRIVMIISGKIEDTSITHPLIIDLVPSGLEIENPNISGIDEISKLPWLKNLSKIENVTYADDRFSCALNNNYSTFKIAYTLRAVTLGTYTLSPVVIEDMYKPRYRANSKPVSTQLIIKEKSKILTHTSAVTHHDTNTTQKKTLTSDDYTQLIQRGIGNLEQYSLQQLNYLRNGIFAQKGLDFSQINPSLHKQFQKYNWYTPVTKDSAKVFKSFTPIQRKNVITLLNEEKNRCGGSLVLADFYRVNIKPLSASYLKKYSQKDLRILRISLMARYGYIPKDKFLESIYKQMPWYTPDSNGTANNINDKMNFLQSSNMKAILSVEKK